MEGSVTVNRAGVFTLSVKVDGTDVISSPHVAELSVQPTDLYPANCVLVEVPDSMVAGFDYSFLIQGRDIYYNNI